MNRKKLWKIGVKGVSLFSATVLLVACQGASEDTALNRSPQDQVGTVEQSSSEETPRTEESLLRGVESFKTTSAAELKIPLIAATEDVPEDVFEEEMETFEEPINEEPEIAEPVEEEPIYQEPIYEEPEPVYTYETTYEEVILPLTTQYIGNSQMDNDQFYTQQFGKDGKIVYTWLHVYEDGVLIDSHITKTSRLEPIPEIHIVGTNIAVVPESSSYEEELAKMKERFPEAFE